MSPIKSVIVAARTAASLYGLSGKDHLGIAGFLVASNPVAKARQNLGAHINPHGYDRTRYRDSVKKSTRSSSSVPC